MKFTKNDAVEALKAKIPTKDKDLDLDRTISEIVDNNMEIIGEESEMELTDFVDKTWKSVKTAIGLTHSENSKVAQKLKDQIAELQSKIEGKTPPKKDDDPTIKSDDPAIQKLLDEMKEMKDKLSARETEETVAEKRKQLVAKMSESIKDKDWIESYLSEISITAETDVEAKAKDYVAFYNKTQARSSRFTPKSTDNPDENNSEVKKTLEDARNILLQRQGIVGQSVTVKE